MRERIRDILPQKTPAWRKLVNRAHGVLYDPADQAAVVAMRDRLQAFVDSDEKGANRPELRIMLALAEWRLTGEMPITYQNANEARLQMWELEKFCPVLDFQKPFVTRVAADFPNAPGPNKFKRVFDVIEGPVDPRFDTVNEELVILRRPGATTTVIGFSGLQGLVSGMSWTMFDRAITQKLNANLIVVRDFNHLYYVAGIQKFGTLDQTVAGLGAVLKEFGGTRIVAAGGSAGVFGALYLSCRLGIRHVVASSGPTSLDIGVDEGDRQRYLVLKERAAKGEVPYPDVARMVAESQIGRVDFFVAGQHDYDMRQMRHLQGRTDVVVPHVYEDEDAHSIIDRAIADGSFLQAFREDVPVAS